MHPRAALPSLVLALVLGLSGCQGEGPGGTSPDPAAIRAELAARFAGDHPGAKETGEGACFADRFTDVVTPAELRAARLLDASYAVVPDLPPLAEPVAEAWADAQFACTDFVAESTSAQVEVSRGRLDARAYAGCLGSTLTTEQLRAAVVDSLTGTWDGDDLERLSTAQADCARGALPPD